VSVGCDKQSVVCERFDLFYLLFESVFMSKTYFYLFFCAV